jgi:hypothetical protein
MFSFVLALSLLNIWACYSWEMTLDVDNKQDWKHIKEKAGKINSMQAYERHNDASR